MQKLRLKIDVSKIDKSKLIERTYTNKEGKEVTVKEMIFDCVEMREPQVIPTQGNFILKKTHFIAYPSKKLDDGTYEETKYVGEATQIENGTDAIDESPF
jgi:hypothetical protein